MSDVDDMLESEEEYFSEPMDVSEAEADPGHDDGLEGGIITRRLSYQVLEESKLLSETQHEIESVQEICSLPSMALAGAMLRHFKWNKETLISDYMESPEKALKEAGISSLKSEKQKKDSHKKVNCLVCMEDVRFSKTFALACGHRYCNTCWKTYLELRIAEGTDCVHARCMNPKCTEVVHEDAFKKLVSKETFKVYSKHLTRSFIADNPLVKYCPAPDCKNLIRCERKGRQEAVLCKCGFQWCFSCCDFNIGDHMPATCQQVEKWLQKASDESENVNWLLANTKKCPQCRSPIEKNGGCMHMTCRRNAGGCGYEFCWLCRGSWKEHGPATGGFYACNKYEKSDAKKEDEKAGDAKTELELYMFYYHRYESHRNAMKIADDQRKNANAKGVEIQRKFDIRSQDTKFLLEATEQLLCNRRVLQWSYVYGYYLDKTKTAEKNLFEYLQTNLESHTNHLSELYEKPLDKIADYQAFYKWKEDVTNYTRVTKKFLDNFVEGVSGGLTVDHTH